MIGNNGIVKAVKDLVGSLGDHVSIPFVKGATTIIGYLQTMYYHIHGPALVYPDKADPVTITSAAPAWSTAGAITEVIPANAVTKPFDLHWISVSDISDTGYYIVDIFAGAPGEEVHIGEIDGWRTSNFVAEGSRQIMIPQQPANTRISCRLSNSTTSAITVKIKFQGHTYG